MDLSIISLSIHTKLNLKDKDKKKDAVLVILVVTKVAFIHYFVIHTYAHTKLNLNKK